MLQAQALVRMLSRRVARPQGGINISQILWIVIGGLIAGGALLWFTKGGGLSDITNLFTTITNEINTAISTF